MNDHAGGPPPPHGVPGPDFGSRLRDDLVMGLRFYSRIPVPRLPHETPVLNRVALALPFTSLAIGLGPAMLLVILVLLGLPGFYSACLATAALLCVTGAMAEDALADAADGLGGGTTVARRLEIMRDPRHGTYGIAALVLFLLLRAVAVGGMAQVTLIGAACLWLAAMILARSGALWLAVVLPPARPDGASAAAGGVSRPAFATGGAFALVLALLLCWPASGIGAFLAAVLACVPVTLGWTLLCRRLVGGQTGDLIGALQALLELTALTVFLAFT